jgi:hypothetical protein
MAGLQAVGAHVPLSAGDPHALGRAQPPLCRREDLSRLGRRLPTTICVTPMLTCLREEHDTCQSVWNFRNSRFSSAEFETRKRTHLQERSTVVGAHTEEEREMEYLHKYHYQPAEQGTEACPPPCYLLQPKRFQSRQECILFIYLNFRPCLLRLLQGNMMGVPHLLPFFIFLLLFQMRPNFSLMDCSLASR